MQSTYYQEYFRKNGIELISPDLADQEQLDNIIFNKFIPGQKTSAESIEIIKNIIRNYPADGIVLGCMRLPIFFNSTVVSEFKLVDVLERHISDIVNSAIKD